MLYTIINSIKLFIIQKPLILNCNYIQDTHQLNKMSVC